MECPFPRTHYQAYGLISISFLILRQFLQLQHLSFQSEPEPCVTLKKFNNLLANSKGNPKRNSFSSKTEIISSDCKS